MSVRLLNDYCRLLLRGGAWRRFTTSSVLQDKRWSDDDDALDKSKKKITKEPIDRIGEDLQAAVKSVAESLPGDKKQTQSDLLAQLLNQTSSFNASKAESVQKKPTTTTSSSTSELLGKMTIQKKTVLKEKEGKGNRVLSNRSGRAISTAFELFEGPDLGIFDATTKPATLNNMYDRRKTLRHQLEQEEFAKKCQSPPKNAFEEMIDWTEQGKLWTFPINNEAGMDEEANVGFHQHVFLEDQIADFPKKGPIQHFMQLVLVGLSKNPYLTVQQKHEHINWFRQYFKEKEVILKEALGDASQFSENPPSTSV